VTVVKTDVLSDVLRAVRLTGGVYFDFDLSSPWVAEPSPSRTIAGTVMPGVAEVATAVGDESDAAFSRVFKKAVGQSPVTWRRSRVRVA
jgi:AraC-like DNA-binding protein